MSTLPDAAAVISVASSSKRTTAPPWRSGSPIESLTVARVTPMRLPGEVLESLIASALGRRQ